jgi:hypothetical protein
MLRWQLVKALGDLLANSERPLKIFISSRPDGDIRRYFTGKPNIEIDATDNQVDIEKFINEEIDRPRPWGDPISQSLRRDVINILVDGSQGMSVISKEECHFVSANTNTGSNGHTYKLGR